MTFFNNFLCDIFDYVFLHVDKYDSPLEMENDALNYSKIQNA